MFNKFFYIKGEIFSLSSLSHLDKEYYNMVRKKGFDQPEKYESGIVIDNYTLVIKDFLNTMVTAGTLYVEKTFTGLVVGHIEDLVVDDKAQSYDLDIILIKELIKLGFQCHKYILYPEKSKYEILGFRKSGAQMVMRRSRL